MTKQLALTFDLDGESLLYRDAGGDGSKVFDTGLQSFGPQVGMPRLLELAADLNIPITVFIPARIIALYPQLVRTIHQQGHELALHGYDHEAWASLTRQQEADILARSLDELSVITGEAVGFRSPSWQLNPWTVDLLLEHGFRYDSSFMHRDHPYTLKSSTGTLPELPVHWALEDWPYWGFLPSYNVAGPVSPSTLTALWDEEVRGVWAYGGVPVLTSHPQVSGRAGRILAMRRLFETYLQEGVEFVRMDALLEQADQETIDITLPDG